MNQHDKTRINMDKARIEGLIARKEGPGAVQFSLGEGGPVLRHLFPVISYPVFSLPPFAVKLGQHTQPNTRNHEIARIAPRMPLESLAPCFGYCYPKKHFKRFRRSLEHLESLSFFCKNNVYKAESLVYLRAVKQLQDTHQTKPIYQQ